MGYTYGQFSLGATGALSVPTGVYGSNSDIDDGFATTGGGFNLEMDYGITETIGVSLLWGGLAHGVDEVALAAETDLSAADISTGDMGIGYFMPGLTIGKSTDQGTLKVHLRIGSLVMISPEVYYDGTRLAEEETSDAALAGGIGVDYTYYLSGGVGLMGGIDILAGTVEWPDSDSEQEVSVLNLKLGLKYTFGRN